MSQALKISIDLEISVTKIVSLKIANTVLILKKFQILKSFIEFTERIFLSESNVKVHTPQNKKK